MSLEASAFWASLGLWGHSLLPLSLGLAATATVKRGWRMVQAARALVRVRGQRPVHSVNMCTGIILYALYTRKLRVFADDIGELITGLSLQPYKLSELTDHI